MISAIFYSENTIFQIIASIELVINDEIDLVGSEDRTPEFNLAYLWQVVFLQLTAKIGLISRRRNVIIC